MPARMIEFTPTRTSTASIETLFDVMTDHRGLVDTTWMFRRTTLEREGTAAPNGVGAIRRLVAIGPPFIEEIVEYERPTRWAYTLLSSAPNPRSPRHNRAARSRHGHLQVSWHLQGALTIPAVDQLMQLVFQRFIDELLKGAITTAERRAVDA